MISASDLAHFGKDEQTNIRQEDTKMARPTTKTPVELAAELESRAQRIRERAAKDAASGDPRMAHIQGELDKVNAEIITHSRKLTGPNSFENRVQSLALRSKWIDAEQAEVNAKDMLARATKDYLQHSLSSLATKIQNGEDVSNDVSEIMANTPQDANIATLSVATAAAEIAWRTFGKEAKGEAIATANEGA